MNTLFMRLLIFYFSVTASSALAQAVSVVVPLSPAGEFTLKSDKIVGKLKKKGSSYSASVLKTPISSLKTGIKLRDKHTHERLGAPKEKFVTVKNIKIKDGKGTAHITVNKVSKPLSFEAEEDGNHIKVKFTLKPSDFNLKDIRYMNVGVEDEVEAEISVPYE